jgi:hypothetical protein
MVTPTVLPMAGTAYDPTRMNRRRWFVMSGGWTLVLVPWVVAAPTADHGVVGRLLLALTVVAYGATYMFGMFGLIRVTTQLREGVTNVVRHSGAGRCTVRLRPDSIEVLDDGVGAPASTPAGNGRSGLAEGVAAVGGSVESGPRAEGGYRLAAVCRVDVPAESS